MRTKTPPTNIYFNVKGHSLGAQGEGGHEKYINMCVYKVKNKNQVKKNMNTMVQIIAYNATTTIFLCRYAYAIIFVFLRFCSSHQLLYTFTTYIRKYVVV